MTEVRVYPIFPSLIAIAKVNSSDIKTRDILSKVVFDDTQSLGSTKSFSSQLNILDSFPKQKKILFNVFNEYKNDSLKLDETDFVLTTSWVTKTSPGGYCQFHNHKNSVFSAVYYFDDIFGGDIEFESYGIFPNQIMLNDPSEWTLYNATRHRIKPHKGEMIIFPSYLYHRITENTSLHDRYSLAFNFFPIGAIGFKDSYINLKK